MGTSNALYVKNHIKQNVGWCSEKCVRSNEFTKLPLGVEKINKRICTFIPNSDFTAFLIQVAKFFNAWIIT